MGRLQYTTAQLRMLNSQARWSASSSLARPSSGHSSNTQQTTRILRTTPIHLIKPAPYLT